MHWVVSRRANNVYKEVDKIITINLTVHRTIKNSPKANVVRLFFYNDFSRVVFPIAVKVIENTMEQDITFDDWIEKLIHQGQAIAYVTGWKFTISDLLNTPAQSPGAA